MRRFKKRSKILINKRIPPHSMSQMDRQREKIATGFFEWAFIIFFPQVHRIKPLDQTHKALFFSQRDRTPFLRRILPSSPPSSSPPSWELPPSFLLRWRPVQGLRQRKLLGWRGYP